jgi:hypothetical protein
LAPSLAPPLASLIALLIRRIEAGLHLRACFFIAHLKIELGA